MELIILVTNNKLKLGFYFSQYRFIKILIRTSLICHNILLNSLPKENY